MMQWEIGRESDTAAMGPLRAVPRAIFIISCRSQRSGTHGENAIEGGARDGRRPGNQGQ